MTPNTLARNATLALVLGAALLQAHAADRVDRRQARQEQRIDQGIASGELTRPEAARLTRGQNHIDRMENRAEADGQVTGREAVRLENAQDHASRRIYRNKHDRQQRQH
ncbi:hypothetical protein [Hydrogenophaga crocea]|uniref:DUF4148 domain-containing protein n=1 Tax=Hydrogenophaga crocea TaxID=2716225 RepID=A0A6G8IIM5_9BURK|nr:hypothetical protein [Hydrogenophaga crocea]QIM53001.1 hypothetical protein G9Q37_13040 [Hydrogenophaga crocea]